MGLEKTFVFSDKEGNFNLREWKYITVNKNHPVASLFYTPHLLLLVKIYDSVSVLGYDAGTFSEKT